MGCCCMNHPLTQLIFVASKLTQYLPGILVLILLCHDLVLSPFFHTLFYILNVKTSQISSCIWTTLNKHGFQLISFLQYSPWFSFLFQSHHVYTNHWNHFFPYFALQFFSSFFFFLYPFLLLWDFSNTSAWSVMLTLLFYYMQVLSGAIFVIFLCKSYEETASYVL